MNNARLFLLNLFAVITSSQSLNHKFVHDAVIGQINSHRNRILTALLFHKNKHAVFHVLQLKFCVRYFYPPAIQTSKCLFVFDFINNYSV